MIKEILELLRAEDWRDGSEIVQIAKGKYKTPTNFKEARAYIKRKRNG
jgi:hypothetical protein